MEQKHNGVHGVGPKNHGIFPAHRKRTPLSTMQSHIVAAVAEFVGTFMFLFLAFAGHLMAVSREPTPGTADNQTVLIIGLAYAISLLVNVWAFYRISGGLFNPAVSDWSSFVLPHISSSCLTRADADNSRPRPHRTRGMGSLGIPRSRAAPR